MKSHFTLLKFSFRRQIAYKVNFLGELAFPSAFLFMQFLFVSQLTKISGTLGGYTTEELNLIFVVFAVFGFFLAIISHSMESFFCLVASGKIEPYLTKPLPVWSIMLLAWSRPAYSFNILLVVFSALFFIPLPAANFSCRAVIEFLASLVCMLTLNLCFLLSFNLVTYYTGRKMPSDYFHEIIYEPSYLPLSVYPQAIVGYLLLSIPISFSASLPVSFLLEKGDWNIFYLVGTTSMTALFTWLFYKRAIGRFIGFGG